MFGTKIKKYKVELTIFAAAFLIRFIYAIAVQSLFGSHTFISFSDAAMYLKVANNLINFHTISQVTNSPFLIPDPLRTPFYPLFLAFFVWLKFPLLVIVAIQDAMAGLMAVMTYRLGIKIFESRAVGIIAALIFVIEPMSIYWNNLLMSDTLASFLFLSAVYLFASKKYYLTSLAMGLATLTRPTHLFFFPIFLLMFAYEYYKQSPDKTDGSKNHSIFWKQFLLMFLIFFLTVLPWTLRNKIQFNSWELSSNSWFAMYYFNAEKFAEIKNEPYKFPPMPVDPNYHPDTPERNFIYYYEFSNVPFYKNYILGLISKYPIDYLKFHFTSAISGFDNHDYNYISRYVLGAKVPTFNQKTGDQLVIAGQTFWFIIYGLAIYGFFIKNKKIWQLFLASFYLVNNSLTGYISTVSAGGRYNLPFLPLTLLLASYGLIHLYSYIRNRKLST